jgi:hypothetical protein
MFAKCLNSGFVRLKSFLGEGFLGSSVFRCAEISQEIVRYPLSGDAKAVEIEEARSKEELRTAYLHDMWPR